MQIFILGNRYVAATFRSPYAEWRTEVLRYVFVESSLVEGISGCAIFGAVGARPSTSSGASAPTIKGEIKGGVSTPIKAHKKNIGNAYSSIGGITLESLNTLLTL